MTEFYADSGRDFSGDSPLAGEGAAELERRVAKIKKGEASTVPWTTVRDEALRRLRSDDC